MSGWEIVGLVVTLITGGGLGALLSWRQDRRRAPIERQQADEASAKVQSEIRTADIDGLRDIIESLREEVATLRSRVEVAEKRALTAEERAAKAERRAGAADHYIEILLAAWKSPPPPPARPHYKEA